MNTTTVMTNNAYTTTGNYKENYNLNMIGSQNNVGKKCKDIDMSTGFIEEYLMRGKRGTKKTVFSTGINRNKQNANDSSKLIKSKHATDSNSKGIKSANELSTKVVKARKL